MPQNFKASAEHGLSIRADDAGGARIGDEVDIGLVDDELAWGWRRAAAELGAGSATPGQVVQVGNDHERADASAASISPIRDETAREAAPRERLEVVGVAGSGTATWSSQPAG